ncbi:MAG: hypothetical protein RR505_15140, partial [Raoultibacter sp.]
MGRRIVMEKCISNVLKGLLSVCLIAGLAPAVALADTAVSVDSERAPQIVQAVKLDERPAGTSARENELRTTSGMSGAPEAASESAPEARLDDTAISAEQVSLTKQPQQVTAEIALITPDSPQIETVLADGLMYTLNNKDLTATLTGWYGAAPAGDIVLSPKIVNNGKQFTLKSLGGGSF